MYDAVGKKLRAIYHTTLPSTELILDYCENMIYENGELKQVLVDGGISHLSMKKLFTITI